MCHPSQTHASTFGQSPRSPIIVQSCPFPYPCACGADPGSNPNSWQIARTAWLAMRTLQASRLSVLPEGIVGIKRIVQALRLNMMMDLLGITSEVTPEAKTCPTSALNCQATVMGMPPPSAARSLDRESIAQSSAKLSGTYTRASLFLWCLLGSLASSVFGALCVSLKEVTHVRGKPCVGIRESIGRIRDAPNLDRIQMVRTCNVGKGKGTSSLDAITRVWCACRMRADDLRCVHVATILHIRDAGANHAIGTRTMALFASNAAIVCDFIHAHDAHGIVFHFL